MERPEQLRRMFRGSAMRKALRKDRLARTPSFAFIFSPTDRDCLPSSDFPVSSSTSSCVSSWFLSSANVLS